MIVPATPVLYFLLDLPERASLAYLDAFLPRISGALSSLDLLQVRTKRLSAMCAVEALERVRRDLDRHAGGVPRLRRGACGLEPMRPRGETENGDMGAGRPLLMANDRLDVALAAGVDGVHLGAGDLPPEAVRGIDLPEGFVLGLTCHTSQELLGARGRGVDYVGLGSFFPSPTKAVSHGDPRAALRGLPADYPLPIYAIGGITLERLPQVLAHPRVAGVAASAAIQNHPAPARAVLDWRRALNQLPSDLTGE